MGIVNNLIFLCPNIVKEKEKKTRVLFIFWDIEFLFSSERCKFSMSYLFFSDWVVFCLLTFKMDISLDLLLRLSSLILDSRFRYFFVRCSDIFFCSDMSLFSAFVRITKMHWRQKMKSFFSSKIEKLLKQYFEFSYFEKLLKKQLLD